MIKTSEVCGKFSDYSLKYISYLAHTCEKEINVLKYAIDLQDTCRNVLFWSLFYSNKCSKYKKADDCQNQSDSNNLARWKRRIKNPNITQKCVNNGYISNRSNKTGFLILHSYSSKN